MIVFDGFDELSTDERIEFLPNLTQLIKENSENLMVLLTSRLVDGVNTYEISRKNRYYKQYIFKKEEFNYYEGSPIRTGASYILSDIHDEERLIKINENYGINFKKIKFKWNYEKYFSLFFSISLIPFLLIIAPSLFKWINFCLYKPFK